jgi:general secretion pathway protein J
MHPARPGGFTLVELLAALLILSLLAIMSYRALSAVLDSRDHLREETGKWRRVEGFFDRLQHDLLLAAPRPTRASSTDSAATVPAWRGAADNLGSSLEFSRFAAAEGGDAAHHLAYRLNDRHEIELWLWPALDAAPGIQPQRYALLGGVQRFDVQYLDPALAWVNQWPEAGQAAAALPRALRVSVTLASGEQIVRVFALGS